MVFWYFLVDLQDAWYFSTPGRRCGLDEGHDVLELRVLRLRLRGLRRGEHLEASERLAAIQLTKVEKRNGESVFL